MFQTKIIHRIQMFSKYCLLILHIQFVLKPFKPCLILSRDVISLFKCLFIIHMKLMWKMRRIESVVYGRVYKYKYKKNIFL